MTQGLIATAASGLYQTIALTFDPARRVITVLTMLQIGLPTLFGLVWAFNNPSVRKASESHMAAVMLAYFILAGSWFAWWEVASMGWPRYLFPSSFLASIFVSAMLHEWTNGFQIWGCLRGTAVSLARLSLKWRDLRFIGALLLVSWAAFQTGTDLANALIGKTNRPLFETVSYLNNNTPASAVIETYESELFFFLERRYHYPPDQIH